MSNEVKDEGLAALLSLLDDKGRELFNLPTRADEGLFHEHVVEYKKFQETKRRDAARAYEAERKSLREKYSCKKCNGTGHIGAFQHIEMGKCFRCDGTGLDANGRRKIAKIG